MKGKTVVLLVLACVALLVLLTGLFAYSLFKKPTIDQFEDLPPFLASCEVESSSRDRAGDDAGESVLIVCSNADPNWRDTLLRQMPPEQGWEVDQEYLDIVMQKGLYEPGEFAYVKRVDGKLVARCHGFERDRDGKRVLSFRFKQFREFAF